MPSGLGLLVHEVDLGALGMLEPTLADLRLLLEESLPDPDRLNEGVEEVARGDGDGRGRVERLPSHMLVPGGIEVEHHLVPQRVDTRMEPAVWRPLLEPLDLDGEGLEVRLVEGILN